MASTTTALGTRQMQNAGFDNALRKRNALKPTSKLASRDVKGNYIKPLGRQNGTTNLRKPVVAKGPIKQSKIPLKIDSPAPMEVEVVNVEEISKAPVPLPLNVVDIDKDDGDDPQLCSEFANDVFKYMLYLESEYPIKRNYLTETSLKPKMRYILVDWLFQVHQRFKLLQETAYLTIAVLDRFLQIHPVPRTKLQLAGVTAMLIASKYEEMYAPEVGDFIYITDNSFTRDQILSMERMMLQTLGFNLGRPLPLQFLRRYSKAGEVDATQHALAKYLMELALVDYEMCHVKPSRLAASALCFSLIILDEKEWNGTLTHYSSYSYSDLEPVVCHLARNLRDVGKNQYVKSIRAKFSTSKCLKIALQPELESENVQRLASMAKNFEL